MANMVIETSMYNGTGFDGYRLFFWTKPMIRCTESDCTFWGSKMICSVKVTFPFGRSCLQTPIWNGCFLSHGHGGPPTLTETQQELAGLRGTPALNSDQFPQRDQNQAWITWKTVCRAALSLFPTSVFDFVFLGQRLHTAASVFGFPGSALTQNVLSCVEAYSVS